MIGVAGAAIGRWLPLSPNQYGLGRAGRPRAAAAAGEGRAGAGSRRRLHSDVGRAKTGSNTDGGRSNVPPPTARGDDWVAPSRPIAARPARRRGEFRQFKSPAESGRPTPFFG